MDEAILGKKKNTGNDQRSGDKICHHSIHSRLISTIINIIKLNLYRML